jgi:hypothetical protein
VPLTNIPSEHTGAAAVGLLAASTLFSLAAMTANKTKKTERMKKFQSTLATIAFCGVAVAKQADFSIIEKDPVNMDSIETIATTPPKRTYDSKTIDFRDLVNGETFAEKKIDGSGNNKDNDEECDNYLDKVIMFAAAAAMMKIDKNIQMSDMYAMASNNADGFTKDILRQRSREMKGLCNG